MKRIAVLLTMLFLVLSSSQYLKATEIGKYSIPNVNDVDTYTKLIGKTLYYAPSKSKYSSGYTDWGNLGFDIQKITITSVEGKYKPKKPFQEMKWTVKTESGRTFILSVISGEYTKHVPYSKYLVTDLPFYDLDKWKADNNSLIGQTFANPLVKAQYKVVDFSYGKNPQKYKSLFDSNYFTLLYTVENTITGEKHVYDASTASTDCFMEDISGSFVPTLSKVEKPSNSAIKYGKTTTLTDEKDKGITKFGYKDNYIDITIYGTSRRFYFTLKNVSNFTEKIVWDDAAFVGYNGKSSRIMHSGIRYSEREASQPETSVIKGASIEDVACPTDNVYYSETLKEWDTYSMFPSVPTKEVKKLTLMLPIKIKGVENEYTFIFDLKYVYNHPERLNL